jgi:hypothetical protein
VQAVAVEWNGVADCPRVIETIVDSRERRFEVHLPRARFSDQKRLHNKWHARGIL